MLLILKDKKKTVAGAEMTIAAIMEKLQASGVAADAASFDDLVLCIDKGNVRAEICGKDLSKYSTIFFRRVGERRKTAFIISRIAAQYGTDCIDRVYQNTSAPGKLKQTVVLALSGVPVPKTYYSGNYSQEALEQAIAFLGFPIVVKNSRGQKGRGVFLAKDEQSLKNIISDNEGEEIFLQEFIPNSFDYRVLVLGEDVACVEKRTRTTEGEFRNNVYLGAEEEFIDVSLADERVKKTAIDAARAADIQVAGVDVVQGEDGKTYVFEVNRAPAFTHDEAISPELNLLTEYLIKCEKKNEK